MIPLIEKEDIIKSKKDASNVYDRDKGDKSETDKRLIDNEIIDGKYVTVVIKTDTFERILRRKKYPGESVNQILNKIFDILMLNKKVIKTLEKITSLKKESGLVEVPKFGTGKINEAGKKIAEKESVLTKIIMAEIDKLAKKETVSKVEQQSKKPENRVKKQQEGRHN